MRRGADADAYVPVVEAIRALAVQQEWKVGSVRRVEQRSG